MAQQNHLNTKLSTSGSQSNPNTSQEIQSKKVSLLNSLCQEIRLVKADVLELRLQVEKMVSVQNTWHSNLTML